MNHPSETMEALRGIIDGLDDPVGGQLHRLLDDVQGNREQRDREFKKLSSAQADAIVHSAGIICELEETRERLEKTRLMAEAAAEEARSLSAFGAILEHSLNEIYIFDRESLRFAHANKGALQNTGYTLDELSRKTPLDIKPDLSREKFQSIIAPLREKTAANVEFKTNHCRKDGSIYPVEVHVEESVFHKRRVYVAIIRDISYRNKMEARNLQLQQDLIAASRKAGMAEVATGVLHNVGNVLNSVNISTSLIKRQFSTSALANLEKVSNLISENESSFAEFVRTDNRGRKLPSYIVKVNDALCDERKKMTEEFDDLAKNVEHIKEIISVQQTAAKSFGLMQELSVEEVIDDVVTATRGALSHHHVTVTCEIEDPNLTITSDRHKLLQILTNLVGNAKDAILECENPDRNILIQVTSDEQALLFRVVDNGIGISPDKIDKIFQHGYTTKKSGHGFGLHASANAATELGGNLSVTSDGIGDGAQFEIRLPKLKNSVTTI